MFKARLLKNARHENVPIRQNESNTFSSSYTLSIYPLNFVCTFIPKNACSSLRYSIAIANGFIKDISDIKWIHSNNKTFIASHREVSCAEYTFVILRCPFKRIASCFLDLFVGRKIKFNDENGQRLSINFHEFLLIIKSQARKDRNQHWRNQSDFLHYEIYDDYFSVESLSKAENSLKDRGFKVFDTRASLKHDLSNHNKIDGDFSKMKDLDLKKMKDEGVIPNYKSMYSNHEVDLVKEIYYDDIELYKSHFGEKNLLY
jgi:hypothetical protein